MSFRGKCYRGKNLGENVTKGKTLQGKMFQGKTAFPPLKAMFLPNTTLKFTSWNFQDFSIVQILCDINLGEIKEQELLFLSFYGL